MPPKTIADNNGVFNLNINKNQRWRGSNIKFLKLNTNISFSTHKQGNSVTIANIKMVIITEQYLCIIEVFVLHTVFKATQIVHNPVSVSNLLENHDTLEENVYIAKENSGHTTADDYTNQQFELVTDNNALTVFNEASTDLVSGSRSVFYEDELSEHK